MAGVFGEGRGPAVAVNAEGGQVERSFHSRLEGLHVSTMRSRCGNEARKVRSPAALLTDKLDPFLEHSAANNCR